MAIKKVVLHFDANDNDPQVVHRAVAKKFEVEVKNPGIVTIAMRRKQGGAFRETDYEFLTFGQTIPAGAIFAQLVPQPGDQLVVDVEFQVRTGSNFEGRPLFGG